MHTTFKSNGPGIVEIFRDGEFAGMIMGDEHYTGQRRRCWIINLHGAPRNQTMTLREAKHWAS